MTLTLEAARLSIHSARKADRDAARLHLLEHDPCRYRPGDTAEDWLLGPVTVARCWPTEAGARGWRYLVSTPAGALYVSDLDEEHHP